MVGLVDAGPPASVQPLDLGFTVSHQKVHLDLDLKSRSLKGSTQITINPLSSELKTVKLNCRQAKFTKFSIGGRAPSLNYVDLYKQARIPWKADVHQYHMLQDRVDNHIKDSLEVEPELSISIPKSVRIQELDPSTLLDSTGRPTGDTAAADLTQSTKNSVEQRFTPIIISIEYVIENICDGLNFAGWEEDDLQYPHVYTGKLSPYSSCCLFPCVDAIDARCTWEISICTPRTLGDAFSTESKSTGAQTNGIEQQTEDDGRRLSDEDRALDLTVVCSGDVTDEVCTLSPRSVYDYSRFIHRSLIQVIRPRRQPRF